MQKMRVNCIEVICSADLNITFRLTLPIKPSHVNLLDPTKVQSYIRRDKIRYHFVFESADRVEVLKQMTAAQSVINAQKIVELQERNTLLLNRLSELQTP